MAFVKLDTGMPNSSIWSDRDKRTLFTTTLLLAVPHQLRRRTPQLHVRSLEPTGWVVPAGWYGLVAASGTQIVHRDGIPDTERGLTLLEELCSPDPDSRSQAYDGRRLARVDGGYLVLNYFKYRDRDHTAAVRAKRYRDRVKQSGAVSSRRDAVTRTCNVTLAEAKADGRSTSKKPRGGHGPRWYKKFESLWTDRCGGLLPRFAAEDLGQVVEQLGEAEAHRRFEFYLSCTDPSRCRTGDFASKHGAYAEHGLAQ